MTFTLKPKYNYSIVGTTTWRKDDKYVIDETEWRTGRMDFEANQDQLDALINSGVLDNENGINPITIEVDKIDHMSLIRSLVIDDDNLSLVKKDGYEFKNMDFNEIRKLEERFEDEDEADDMILEELGWYIEDSEFEFQGTLVIEDNNGNILGKGE